MLKNGINHIILLLQLTLISSKIEPSEISNSLFNNIFLPKIPSNTDFYVNDLRITEKTIKHYKISIDQSFEQRVSTFGLKSELAKKIKDTRSSAFQYSGGRGKSVIEGGFVDENILHYYFVSYKVGGTIMKIKKFYYDGKDTCGREYPRRLSEVSEKRSTEPEKNNIQNLRKLISCPKKPGCYILTKRTKLFGFITVKKEEFCCCPIQKTLLIGQTRQQRRISYKIMDHFGMKRIRKELLERIIKDYSLEL